jgi:ribosomal protein S27AE
MRFDVITAPKERYYSIKLNDFSETETIESAAPNGGKCPNCKIGGLSFSHYGKNGAEYYSCVRCGYVVKN